MAMIKKTERNCEKSFSKIVAYPEKHLLLELPLFAQNTIEVSSEKPEYKSFVNSVKKSILESTKESSRRLVFVGHIIKKAGEKRIFSIENLIEKKQAGLVV
jgi:hypothetical protein